MTNDQREQFEALASNFRAWPKTDPAGLAERFNELAAYVDEIIEDAKSDTAADCMDWAERNYG